MNPNSPAPAPAPLQFVWWVLWVSMISAVGMFYFFLGGPVTGGDNFPAVMIGAMMAVPLLIGTFIRWIIIPRTQKVQVAFKGFIIGMALAEGICFYGIFLFPKFKLLATFLSIVGMLQFMPLFTGRFYVPPKL